MHALTPPPRVKRLPGRKPRVAALAAVLLVVWYGFAPAGTQTGLVQATLTHDGLERTYAYYCPAELPQKAPLVFVLHGSYGSGRSIRRTLQGRLEQLADQEGFVVVYPDGYRKHWNGCRTTPKDAAHKMNVDDEGFLCALIDTLVRKHDIDRTRVYAVGFSNGGHLCFRLAHEAPLHFAALATVAAQLPAPHNSACRKPPGAVPFLFINGTHDPISPFEGGQVRLLGLWSKGHVLSAWASATELAKANGQQGEPCRIDLPDMSTRDRSRVELISWDKDVHLYVVHGGGHTLPGARQYLPALLVGRTNRDICTADVIWNFFKQHHARPDTAP